jgi:hypothetical protein
VDVENCVIFIALKVFPIKAYMMAGLVARMGTSLIRRKIFANKKGTASYQA